MAKKKNKPTEEEIVKDLEILNAVIKDDFCNYKYKILRGVGAGNSHNVEGTGIIDADMSIAFSKLNAHLAYIDDAFKNAGVEVENIDNHHLDELTQRYQVTGFQVKGSAESPAVILIGTKRVDSCADVIDIKSPKIDISRSAFYKWYNELHTELKKCIDEVEQYHNGKYTVVEQEEVEDKKQMKITDAVTEEEFDNAKVD